MTNTYLNFDTTILTRIEKIEVKCKTILVRLASSQQKVLCNWGMTSQQSAAVHIQALYPADGILPVSSSKLRLLVINLASVPGGQ